ncbi:hypothetical protein DES53_11672 [Roseimicrobium gellanilyticum]|uniref:Uncharacterized protein n=1 Tax=Roseimicrobium gellanilyticum TaxID=748857 RepID=A0A366H5Y8_9BACT|nr:hypothetical protein [Roseimicrobium gellanilyticum]RBP36633.1 hypothetical protein DES53_11672 [Roseimicrobium gellanilyticum]
MMSSSAVTLQCPACGGVFLTLQQGTGGAEICPHCSMSAPRARYRSMESQNSPGARTTLPPRRPESAPGTTSQPVPVITAAMTPEAVDAERPITPATLPPVRPGFATGPVSILPPPQSFEATAPTPAPASPAPLPIPIHAPATTPGLMPPVSTTDVQVLSMQLPAPEATPGPMTHSERVAIPPVPPGEVPLPSRVLQTLATPTTSVPTYHPAQAPVASPFSVAATPTAEHPALAPIAPPAPPQPLAPESVAAAQPPAFEQYAPMPAYAAATAPTPTPAYEAPPAPAPVPAYEAPPAPQPELPPQYQYHQYAQAAPAISPAQLPVAYPPVPAPPPQPVDLAAQAKVSPAQLWEAAMLQHYHQQAQEATITPTGRELFPTGSVPTFQPPPPPPGPVTFGPLTPPPSAEVSPAAYAPPPQAASAPVPEPTLPAENPQEFNAPRPGGTVLPTARSAPPAVPLHAYGALPVVSGADPLPPPQIGFVSAPQVEPPPIPAEGDVPPATSPFGMATATSPVEVPALPPPSALSEPATTPTPDFIAALEQVQAQVQTQAPMQSFFTSAEPPADPSIYASAEPPAIVGDPPAAFVPSPTQPPTVAPQPAPAAESLAAQPPQQPQQQEVTDSHPHHSPHPAQDLALVAAKMVRSSGPPPAPAPSSRRAPWIAGLVLGSLALAGGLHFLKDRLPPLLNPGDDTPPTPTQASNNSKTPLPPTPSPEIKKANAPTPAELAANASTPSPEVRDAQVPARQTALATTAPASTDASPTSTTPDANAASGAPPDALPVPPMPPAPAQEEVRRAMPSNPETLSISQEDPLSAIAAKLMFGIDSASSAEERARWIADPDKHSADMERLIRLRGGRLNTREVQPLVLPNSGPIHALPSGEQVSLFRVTSPASRGGALLRLHAQNGGHFIDWPLFAQTYDNAFDRFVATNRAIPGKAEWFTVLCSLIGDPNGKNATREAHLRLKVQGSLAETGVTEAWAEKNTPAGRYLLQEMAPGHTYLIDIQFGASDAGNRRLMVLDCAATRGESAQANANK